jgi:hypothetical protein
LDGKSYLKSISIGEAVGMGSFRFFFGSLASCTASHFRKTA